jgi:Flp pilus assembly pilin Flp
MPVLPFRRRPETSAAVTEPDRGTPADEVVRRPRRAATAMEYLVVASFILVVLIAGVQHLASATRQTMQHDADATDFSKQNQP